MNSRVNSKYPFRRHLLVFGDEERLGSSSEVASGEEETQSIASAPKVIQEIAKAEKPSLEEWARWIEHPDERVIQALFKYHGIRVQNLPSVMEWISHRVLGREEGSLWHPLLDEAVKNRWLRSEWAREAAEARAIKLAEWLRDLGDEAAVWEMLSFDSSVLARIVARSSPVWSDEIMQRVVETPLVSPDVLEREDLRPEDLRWLSEWATGIVLHVNQTEVDEERAVVITRKERDAAARVLAGLARQSVHPDKEQVWRLIEALSEKRRVPLAEEVLTSLLLREDLEGRDFWRMYDLLQERVHLLQHVVRHPLMPVELLERAIREDVKGQIQNTLIKNQRATREPSLRRAFAESARSASVLRTLLRNASLEEFEELFPRLVDQSASSALDMLESHDYPAAITPSAREVAAILQHPMAHIRLRAMVSAANLFGRSSKEPEASNRKKGARSLDV